MKGEVAQSLTQAEWEQMAPLLDELVAKLGAKDRRAVLLRFYERKNMAEVGREMGVSGAAAQKRLERAVGKMRSMFGRRGVGVASVGLLAAGLEANTAWAADAGLAATATKAALSAGQGGVVGGQVAMILKGAINMMTMAKVKVAAVVLRGRNADVRWRRTATDECLRGTTDDEAVCHRGQTERRYHHETSEPDGPGVSLPSFTDHACGHERKYRRATRGDQWRDVGCQNPTGWRAIVHLQWPIG